MGRRLAIAAAFVVVRCASWSTRTRRRLAISARRRRASFALQRSSR